MPGVIRENAMAEKITENSFGIVAGDVTEPVVVIRPMLLAQFANPIKEKPRKQADADPQLQDANLFFSAQRFALRAFRLLRLHQAGEEQVGGIARQCAVIVDDERHGNAVANEGFRAPAAKVLLADLPFEALADWAEVFNDLARALNLCEDLF